MYFENTRGGDIYNSSHKKLKSAFACVDLLDIPIMRVAFNKEGITKVTSHFASVCKIGLRHA